MCYGVGMVDIYSNAKDRSKLEQLDKPEAESWVVMREPTHEELDWLVQELGIDEEILEDAIDEYELPRLRQYKNNIVLIVRSVSKTEDGYITYPLTIVLNNERQVVVTIVPHTSEIIDTMLKKQTAFSTGMQSQLVIRILLSTIRLYERYIAQIRNAVPQAASDLHRITKNDIIQLVKTEEMLSSLLSSLQPSMSTVEKLLASPYFPFYKGDKALIDEVLIDGYQAIELSKTHLRIIRNIRNVYTTVLSLRLNQIIRLLTYLTALLTIPMLISSMYGMNVTLPLQHDPNAFWILMGGALVAIAVAIGAFGVWRSKL